MFRETGVGIDDETARILLAGLLSDTRNLSKSTTQHEDSVAWTALVAQLQLEDKVAEAIFGSSLRPGVTYSKENLSRKQIVPRIMEKLQ